MKIIMQIGVLFAFLGIGELLAWLTGLPIPSSIFGMVALTASLKAGIVKTQWIDTVADFLTKNLGFFFIPAGIGLINCFGLLKTQWIPILTATILSTWIIIAVTGWTHRIVRKAHVPKITTLKFQPSKKT